MPLTERRKRWRTQFVAGILVRVEQARREYFGPVWFVILLNIQVEVASRLLDTQVWSSVRRSGMEILTLYNRHF